MKKMTTEVRDLIAMLDHLAVEKHVATLPGVAGVVMNPGAEIATVTYDEIRTDAGKLAEANMACGFHCRGEAVPRHICIPDRAVVPAEHTRAPQPLTLGTSKVPRHWAVSCRPHAP